MTSAFSIMETLLQQFPQLFGRLEAILHQLVKELLRHTVRALRYDEAIDVPQCEAVRAPERRDFL
jgi:hypothetical protein